MDPPHHASVTHRNDVGPRSNGTRHMGHVRAVEDGNTQTWPQFPPPSPPAGGGAASGGWSPPSGAKALARSAKPALCPRALRIGTFCSACSVGPCSRQTVSASSRSPPGSSEFIRHLLGADPCFGHRGFRVLTCSRQQPTSCVPAPSPTRLLRPGILAPSLGQVLSSPEGKALGQTRPDAPQRPRPQGFLLECRCLGSLREHLSLDARGGALPRTEGSPGCPGAHAVVPLCAWGREPRPAQSPRPEYLPVTGGALGVLAEWAEDVFRARGLLF